MDRADCDRRRRARHRRQLDEREVPSVVKGNGTYSFVLKTTGVTALALASREDSAHMLQLVIKTQ